MTRAEHLARYAEQQAAHAAAHAVRNASPRVACRFCGRLTRDADAKCAECREAALSRYAEDF